MDKEELIEHARVIKEYCENCGNCNDCPFHIKGEENAWCTLWSDGVYPSLWYLPDLKGSVTK